MIDENDPWRHILALIHKRYGGTFLDRIILIANERANKQFARFYAVWNQA